MRRIQISIKTRTCRVLRRWPRKYARRFSRTNRGIYGKRVPGRRPCRRRRRRRRRKTRGWSAVSSSLEPSPPTGHYCLVPYSVTNCFIKLKSHNPHCNASRRPCASTLHPLSPPGPFRFSPPCIYAPTCRIGPRAAPSSLLWSSRILFLGCPRKFSRASVFPI